MSSSLVLPLAAPFLVRSTPARLDAEILRRARAGDETAISQILETQRAPMLHLAFSILRDRESAEDAAQEIFVRALQKLPSFRGQSEFSTWLYRVALSVCLEKQRAQKRRNQLAPPCDLNENDAPQRDFSRQIETRLALETALDALDENSRIALLLREWHGLSYEEIAQVLRVPVGTVKSRLSKARERFTQIWEAQHGEI